MFRLLTTSALAALLLGTTACAQDSSSKGMSQSEIEGIVKEYLMTNPEIIRDALIALEEKEERLALEAVQADLFNNRLDATAGPKDAKVTIVEFFDYNCGYCKRSTDWLKEVLEEHPKDVRVIFKELPILDSRTKTSRTAARAALAADRQGKYKEMHFALMAERSLTAERIDILATKVGLDVEQMKKDMADPALELHLQDTIMLANRIPMLTGTPFFLINDEHISGANTDRLDEMLERALAG